MSNNKLLKFINRPLKHPTGTKHLKPVILADSKARYLEAEARTPYELTILWRYKSGSTISEGRT